MGSCPVGHADNVALSEIVEEYRKCPIAFVYNGMSLGTCRKCGRPYSILPQTYATCYNNWLVCEDCLYGYGCMAHPSQSPELPDAKIGEMKWQIVQ